MDDSTFKQLRDSIYEQCGIFFPDTKKYLLESRLSWRIKEKNLRGFEDYLHLLLNGDKEEIPKLFDAVVTNETHFFREPQHFEILTDVLIPKIVEKKAKTTGATLKIWSAACSTGEEPYTIAMLLSEKLNLNPVKIEILATDISENVLASAKKAVYGSYAIRNIPNYYLKKYFANSGQSYSPVPAIKSKVKFQNINLVDEKKMKTMKEMDVIFCRNVLIYFDERAKQKVVFYLYDSLNPGGYLFIGTCESLHNVTRAFRPVVINNVIVYQKL